MTRSFKVVSEAQARIEAIKASGDGVLIGYDDNGDAIVVGAASASASEGEISALLPAPLRILGPLSVADSAAAAPLPANPLRASRTLVRCSVPLTLEVPASSSLAEELGRWEAALTGPATGYQVNGAELAGAQPLPKGSWDAPVMMAPVARAPAALAAPAGAVTPGVETVRWATVCLDVLAYVPPGATAGEAAAKYVAPALAAQLQACRREAAAAKGAALPPLRALHFLPPGLPHHVTVLYPLPPGPGAEAAEAALAGRRRALHAALGLPADRPLLRAANAVDPGSKTSNATNSSDNGPASGPQQTRLRNVHEGLPPSGIKGGSVHLVAGDYDYYHYMQDRTDDSGWGCAYRSLQTLASWFQRQHYTGRAPPGHREIQATLVALGDKPADFLGSKQWIGAIELGFVLDSLLGVACKVITVASGDEMPARAREIAAHFDAQGTPVMIGGGVLAYTLLGVHFNGDTGEAAFLILDPHYTGADEAGKVRAGQWVAWKRLGDKAAAGGDLFVPGAFYNLLCPQRPNTV